MKAEERRPRLIECAGDAVRVIRAGRLIDGTGAPARRNVTVIVRGDTIQDVLDDGGQGADIPPGAEIVDVAQATVMPGLIDAHVHLTADIHLDPYRRYLDPTPQLGVLHAARHANMHLAAGVTTVRDMGLTSPAVALREAARIGLIDSPRILTAGKALTTTSGHGDWHTFPEAWVRDVEPRGFICDGADECRRAVRRNFRDEVDLIKFFASSGAVTNPATDVRPHPNFSDEEVNAIVQEAHEHGLRVAAHVFGRIPLNRVLNAGVDTIEHCILPEGDWPMLDRLIEQDVFLVGTLTILKLTAERGEAWGVVPEGRAAAQRVYENSSRMITEAHRRGARIAAGTDAIGRFMAGEVTVEIELLREAGLSALQAITAATGTAAEALGIDHRTGTIAPGKLADLLIVEGDPLADVKLLQDSRAITAVYFTRARVEPSGPKG